jgi:diaminopimelate epimerase
MVVETDAGLKTVELRLEHHRVVGATVDMGEPILEGRDIPVDAVGRIIDYPLDVAGMRESITALSMGNPHCVVFVADDGVFKLQDRDFAELGRKFEHHPFFPRRVNTEFIMAVSRRNLRMRVWERGSGETWACGTGACAAVVAAVLTNHSERTATVELRGGNLEIEWRAEGADANHVFMTGDAVEVYRGEIELSAGEMVPVS